LFKALSTARQYYGDLQSLPNRTNDDKNNSHKIIFNSASSASSSKSFFVLKPSISYHLYVSHNLCGDASVYPPEMDLRTGSRPVPGEKCDVPNHWDVPYLLRFKPGVRIVLLILLLFCFLIPFSSSSSSSSLTVR
jgi:hypothetical protein